MASKPAVAELSDWYGRYRRLVDARLREIVPRGGVYDLCRYHMGWTDEQGRATEIETGKMLRPVLCLTACSGYGDPQGAVDLAAAIELLHAFSLVHDDIEDGDRERRHRPTVWAQYGLPLAVNAGDAIFALSFARLHSGAEGLDRERSAAVLEAFTSACLCMVEGQHLDIEFEARRAVSLAEYVEMARGKTAAVIGAALAIGALAGGAEAAQAEQLRAAGLELGLAFQATDDLLALWGDPAETGKAIGNDLRRGKKSLPVVLASSRGLGIEGLTGLALPEVQRELERSGCKRDSEAFALEHADRARELISRAGMLEKARRQLESLIEFAVARVR